jgi:hypothetical protein
MSYNLHCFIFCLLRFWHLQTWAKNISDALGFKKPEFRVGATVEDPVWPYDTPGAASALDCVSALAAGANKDHVVNSCSEHTYQYSVSCPFSISKNSVSIAHTTAGL